MAVGFSPLSVLSGAGHLHLGQHPIMPQAIGQELCKYRFTNALRVQVPNYKVSTQNHNYNC